MTHLGWLFPNVGEVLTSQQQNLLQCSVSLSLLGQQEEDFSMTEYYPGSNPNQKIFYSAKQPGPGLSIWAGAARNNECCAVPRANAMGLLFPAPGVGDAVLQKHTPKYTKG